MESPDVNVLVAAMRSDSQHHIAARAWLDHALASGKPVGISELVLSGVIRVVTNPKTFRPASTLEDALEFTGSLLAHPSVRRLRSGEGHWRLFLSLCETTNATGNVVPDAYHAALAVEHGATWITLDRDFAAFRWLRSLNLLAKPEVREARARYGVPPVRRRAGKR